MSVVTSQYVLEIGSSSVETFTSIVERNLLASSELRVLPWQQQKAMTYSPSDLSLREVVEGLESRSFASASWREVKSGVRYVLLYCPNFADNDLNLWLCTVEYTGEEWKSLWGELGEYPELRFACVSQDEGILVSGDQLSPETFPWSEPSLLAAAVRSASGSWVTREAVRST
jgi:hypothetical protein